MMSIEMLAKYTFYSKLMLNYLKMTSLTSQGSVFTIYRWGEQIYNLLVSNLRMLCTVPKKY